MMCIMFTALNEFEGLVITASSDVEMVWILLIILPANELDYSKQTFYFFKPV